MLDAFLKLSYVLLSWLSLVVEIKHLARSMEIVVGTGSIIDVVLCFLLTFGTVGNVILKETNEIVFIVIEEKLTHSIFKVVGISPNKDSPIREYLLPLFLFFAISPFSLVNPI